MTTVKRVDMSSLFKGQHTHKIKVLTFYCIVLVNVIVAFVFIHGNVITSSRTFGKNSDAFDVRDNKKSGFAYTLSKEIETNTKIKYSNTSLRNRTEIEFFNISNFDRTAKGIMDSLSKTTSRYTIISTNRPITCEGCFNVHFEYLINHENICISHNDSIQILLLITSAPHNALARNTIRDTWLTYSNHNKGQVRYVFLLGISQKNTEIYQEDARNMDIILGDFQDTYSNLTLKTLMGFQWAVKFCWSAEFIMKTDDDMYVNMPSLINTIHNNHDILQTAVGGKCVPFGIPVRDKQSKWYASYTSYPQNAYPGYCSGTGYVTSRNVVSRVIQISRNVPFFHLEDVYISLCIKELGYALHDLKGFTDRPELDPCRYKNSNLVTAHKVPIKWMKKIWNTTCSCNVNSWKLWKLLKKNHLPECK